MEASLTHSAPTRSFWILVLIADLLLLLLLPKVFWVAGTLMGLLLIAGALRRIEGLVAFMLLGGPLLDPLSSDAFSAVDVHVPIRILFLIAWFMLLARSGQVERPVTPGAAFGPACTDARTLTLLLLTLIVWCGLLWTGAPNYGLLKAKSFLITSVSLYLCAVLLWPLWRGERGLDRLIMAGIWIGGLIAIIGAATVLGLAPEILIGDVGRHLGATQSRLAWLGSNSIWLARILATWIILLLWAAQRRNLPGALAAVLALIGLGLILRTGSRGPLVALILAPGALLLLPRPKLRRGLIKRVTALLAVMLLLGGTVWFLLPPEEQARVAGALLRSPTGALLGDGGVGAGITRTLSERLLQDPSSVYRLQLARQSLTALRAALPWGTGTGGFATAVFLRDFRIYPHNLEVELLFENGLLGLFLVLLFLMLVWRAARSQAARDDAMPWLWVLFVMGWLNAQVSGDISLNTGLFFWAGMITARRLAARGADPTGSGR